MTAKKFYQALKPNQNDRKKTINEQEYEHWYVYTY